MYSYTGKVVPAPTCQTDFNLSIVINNIMRTWILQTAIMPRRRTRIRPFDSSASLFLVLVDASTISAYSDSPGAVRSCGWLPRKISACVAGEWRFWRSAPTFFSSSDRDPPAFPRQDRDRHPCSQTPCCPMARHPLAQSTCRRDGRKRREHMRSGRSKRGTPRR